MKTQSAKKQKRAYPRCFTPANHWHARGWRTVGIIIGLVLASMWLRTVPIRPSRMGVAAAPPPPLPPVPTATLPPTPTLTPAPTPTSAPSRTSPFAGAFIRLHVQFPQAWPWDKMNCQELYTVVQWQDERGNWHDIAGWCGTLDTMEPTADGHMVGSKVWWLAAENFGTGAFRWQVYRDQAGPLLTTSEVFYLPTTMRRTLIIEVTLSPSALIDENINPPNLPETGVFLRANRRSD